MNLLSAICGQSQRRFEPQLRAPHQRMCGAAALVMAYRRCGLKVSQTDVWQKIARPFEGSFRAHTYLMAQDALQRGLKALILQTHQPWKALTTCWRNNVAVVINHRLAIDSHEGHYSLLAGISSDSIKLHDPLAGPDTIWERTAFLKNWLPQGKRCEIAGNVMLAIAHPNDQPSLWCHCNSPFEKIANCQACRFPIPLEPAVAMGCKRPECDDRLWFQIFCPQCDHPTSLV